MRVGKASPAAASVTLFLLAVACSDVTDLPVRDLQSDTKLVFTVDLQQAVAAGFDVTRVHVTVSNADHSAEINLDIDGATAVGTFENLAVGQYDIAVILYEGETAVASGTGQATVQPGQTVTAVVEMIFTAGNLTVIVTWGPTTAVPLLLLPTVGAVLDNGCATETNSIVWDFDWTDVAGAEYYHLYVLGSSAIYPLIDPSALSVSEYRSELSGYIINSNRYGWQWKVRAMVDGVWNDWSEVRHFDVEPLNSDCGS